MKTPRSPGLVDAHAHLGDAVFDADRADVLDRARQAGVKAVVSVGTFNSSSALGLIAYTIIFGDPWRRMPRTILIMSEVRTAGHAKLPLVNGR